MESEQAKRSHRRLKRILRNRKYLHGTKEKPRMCIMKSNLHLGVQLIDDEKQMTLVSASTMMKDLRKQGMKKSKESAKLLGAKIAELAKAKEIQTVIFDRGRNKYHGLIAQLADSARESGLQF